MVGWTQVTARVCTFVAATGVAVLVAACGSSGKSPSATSSMGSSSTPAGAVAIGTANGPDGTYLTGADGRALYLWLGDVNGGSKCLGQCATQWPPLITTTSASATDGVQSSGLGTITRSDGSKQVTYKGHPLYYFAADSGAGVITGQGSDSFGARWWLVAPSGAAVTKVTAPTGY
jgi:predicted lipoprotein with Yx(FWY)xxD motif